MKLSTANYWLSKISKVFTGIHSPKLYLDQGSANYFLGQQTKAWVRHLFLYWNTATIHSFTYIVHGCFDTARAEVRN